MQHLCSNRRGIIQKKPVYWSDPTEAKVLIHRFELHLSHLAGIYFPRTDLLLIIIQFTLSKLTYSVFVVIGTR
jgi:hypothetical protein